MGGVGRPGGGRDSREGGGGGRAVQGRGAAKPRGGILDVATLIGSSILDPPISNSSIYGPVDHNSPRIFCGSQVSHTTQAFFSHGNSNHHATSPVRVANGLKLRRGAVRRGCACLSCR
ncbi:hypothetical protein E2C01_069501 [Portunus trituberculatus]|uniref:Uncharacterized protein n=1 Tax=Portunus trituberculatus TaxID=210409 RepID=A0A5B7HZI2_PORTR|nr:hypothetical protein [Portunus trituberculatus]